MQAFAHLRLAPSRGRRPKPMTRGVLYAALLRRDQPRWYIRENREQ